MDTRRHYLALLGVEPWQRRKDRLQSKPPESVPTSTQAPSASNSMAISPDSPVQTPSGSVASLDWEQLSTAVAECTACPLHLTRTRPVFGVGNREADWMIIGEAPGADEDRIGEPFVGRAGKLLELMLRAVGLERGEVYIANILKSRPPNNRDPKPEEIAACRPYLDRQIELVQPKIFLVVGRIAAQSLLDTRAPVGTLRGRVHTFQGRPLIVTYHPAYLLRSPAQKAKAWADLQLARRTLAGIAA